MLKSLKLKPMKRKQGAGRRTSPGGRESSRTRAVPTSRFVDISLGEETVRFDVYGACLRGENEGLFYSSGSKDETHKTFSNFYRHRIEHEGCVYNTLEAAFQASKFRGREDFATIREAFSKLETGLEAKRMASRKNMPMTEPEMEAWADDRIAVMARLLWIKFQDPQLRCNLMSTSGKDLVESPQRGDKFWGGNRAGEGLNVHGRLLSVVREFISSAGS
jgi:ribA/ribD-fused uncharacterized protein